MIGPQHQVAVDDDAHRQAGSAGQGGLDVHVAAGHLLADLVHGVLHAVTAGDDDAVAVLAVVGGGQFGADPEQRGQRGTGEDAVDMLDGSKAGV